MAVRNVNTGQSCELHNRFADCRRAGCWEQVAVPEPVKKPRRTATRRVRGQS